MTKWFRVNKDILIFVDFFPTFYNFCFYKTIIHAKNMLRKYTIMCFTDFKYRPRLL